MPRLFRATGSAATRPRLPAGGLRSLLAGSAGRRLLALLAISLAVRLVPAFLVYGSFDVGAWELVNRLEIPYRVVINEAVELAKAYGATDGHKFVNGVLDKVAADVRADEIAALARERGAQA